MKISDLWVLGWEFQAFNQVPIFQRPKRAGTHLISPLKSKSSLCVSAECKHCAFSGRLNPPHPSALSASVTGTFPSIRCRDLIVYDLAPQTPVGGHQHPGRARAGLCVGMSRPEASKGLEVQARLCRAVSSKGLASCLLGPSVPTSMNFGSDCDSQSQIPFSLVFFVLVVEGFRVKSPFEIVYLKARSPNVPLRAAGGCRVTFFRGACLS